MPAAAAEAQSGIQLANIDRGIRPQDDLFGFANGAWLRDVPIPADRSKYGVDTIMLEQSLLRQRGLLAHVSKTADANAQKAAALYASYLNEVAIERAGLAALKPELLRIDAVANSSDVARAMGHLVLIGTTMPFDAYVQADGMDPQRYALWLTQGGLGLPDRDYYLDDNPKFAATRKQYASYVSRLLSLAGERDAAAVAGQIVALETAIARLQWTAVDRRNPQKTYNPRSLAELQTLAPSIDWIAYFDELGVRSPWPKTVARQPDYLASVARRLQETPLPLLKSYLRFRLVAMSAPYLPADFAEADFAFNETMLHDTPKQAERWKRACALVDRLMGDALGKLYVERYFSRSSKQRVELLVSNLLTTYAQSIEQATWLSQSARVEALAKLKKMRIHVGYPATWRDYGGLTISENDLLGNVFRGNAFETQCQIRRLQHRVDRAEWEMTAPTVDAGYNVASNTIEFPAGVLQPPLYDPAADDAYNYGSTVATIGHEISHAFDSRGSRYDADGALRDWWTPQDHAHYDAMTARLVSEFDAFEPIAGFHVNGKLTLPENIADLVGLQIAYKAYLANLKGRTAPTIDSFTGAQRFFIGYAQSFMGKRRDALLIAQLSSNPHAPERDRVNGIAAHIASFYEAFDVRATDRMFISPAERVQIW